MGWDRALCSGLGWHGANIGAPALQSGAATARQLVGNIGWLLFYALLFNASNGAMLGVVVQSGEVSRRLAFLYFPATLFIAMGLVNLIAVVWAARRTAHTDDVLGPRLMLEKVRASTQVTPRVRKPLRHDRA